MYEPVIGLEIHIQLNTKSKMFCSCDSNYFGKNPNIYVCPVCFGLPGALPVPNKAALEKTIALSLALNCNIAPISKFDRKNYYYPDLPKGYQISQYDEPIGSDGYLEIDLGDDSSRIRIMRVHLEEDTAKSLHGENDETLIDFNKSGVPLVEVVTMPDFKSIQEVTAFAKRLHQIVRYADVSNAEMQKGQMRFELNISMKPVGQKELPDYRVEVKNIGSISVLEKTINYEIKRQTEILEKGEEIIQQTRGLADMSGKTKLQRVKETADDYRYFPEPDIPPFKISDSQISDIKNSLPELPGERKQRYKSLGLDDQQSEIFVDDTSKGDWFDNALEAIQNSDNYAKEICKWMVGDISGFLEKKGLDFSELKVQPSDLVYLIDMIKDSKINGNVAKSVVEEIITNGGSAEEIIKSKNLLQISDDSEIEKLVDQVISENPDVVANIAKNPNAIKSLIGKVMGLSKGKANPQSVEKLLKEKLI